MGRSSRTPWPTSVLYSPLANSRHRRRIAILAHGEPTPGCREASSVETWSHQVMTVPSVAWLFLLASNHCNCQYDIPVMTAAESAG